jgi:hypothetical protein
LVSRGAMDDDAHSCWLRFSGTVAAPRSPSPEVGPRADEEQTAEHEIEERLSSKLPGCRVSATLRRYSDDSRRGDGLRFDGLVLVSPEGQARETHQTVPYVRELVSLVVQDVLAGPGSDAQLGTVEVGCAAPFGGRLLSPRAGTPVLALAAGVLSLASSVLLLFALLRWFGALP